MCCTVPCRDEGEEDAAAVFVGGGIVSYPSRQSSTRDNGLLPHHRDLTIRVHGIVTPHDHLERPR